ncbi:MAG TPA: DUF3341 domain-containing protein [Vicinamibacterales bacterium]|nr:DUF3341 domain-containing protein [Vicinamibacterales bacterium]
MAHGAQTTTPFYGLMAEFDSAQALLRAANKVREAGYTKTDAYSAFPIHGLAEALGFRDRRLSRFVLLGGITGGLVGYSLQYWTSVIAYPLNIGGRPLHSWVSFIPPTFELTILFAAFTAGITMMVLNGLPQPYHPVFNAPRFSHASQDAFFLAIEASDPRFSDQATRAFLESLNPREVVAVEH